MTLPKRLYDLYRAVQRCRLVQENNTSPKFLSEFESYLNKAQPENATEKNYQEMIKSIYHCNPNEFMKYMCRSDTRVGSLILWTESKRIVSYFGLRGKVHISWNKDTQKYKVSKYLETYSNVDYKKKRYQIHRGYKRTKTAPVRRVVKDDVNDTVVVEDDVVKGSVVEEKVKDTVVDEDDDVAVVVVEDDVNATVVVKDVVSERWADIVVSD